MSNPFQPMASHYDHAYARLSDDDESDSRRSPTPHHSKAKLRRGKGKGKGKSPPEGEAKINPAVEEKNEETEGEPGREGGEVSSSLGHVLTPRSADTTHAPENPQTPNSRPGHPPSSPSCSKPAPPTPCWSCSTSS